jgi:predicted nuclease with TOPRIM domain
MTLDFNNFKKDPLKYMLFLALGVIAYLYVDSINTKKAQYEELKSLYEEVREENNELRKEMKELELKFIDCIRENEK